MGFDIRDNWLIRRHSIKHKIIAAVAADQRKRRSRRMGAALGATRDMQNNTMCARLPGERRSISATT